MVGGRFSLSAMYFQNRYQCRSGMLEIWRPFGQFAVHTNLAKVDSRKSSVITKHAQGTDDIIVRLQEQLEPGCLAYSCKPSSVVCPRECMACW